jgi:hypothetical protein
MKADTESRSGKTLLVPEWIRACGLWLKSQLDWIPQNWTSSKIKITTRCTVVGWLSAVLFVIHPVQLFLGQVGEFLLLFLPRKLTFLGKLPDTYW